MNAIRSNGTELWDICSSIAITICDEAKEHNLDINNTIHPFKILIPPNLIDVEDWDDVVNYITIAVYNLSLYYISKNMPVLVRSKYLP